MKKQWLVNQYQKGQARVSDRAHLDDDNERMAFDAWWQNNAQKYEDKNPNAYESFEAFYAEDRAEPTTGAPKPDPPNKRPPQTARIAPRSTNDETPTDKPQVKQTAPKQAKKRRVKIDEYPDAMTLEDVAEFLDVSTRTVYRMMDDGEDFGARKVGKRWRVVRRDFQMWWERSGA